MNKLFTVLLFAFLAVTLASDIPEEDGVLVLGTDNFEQVISENEHVLVEFYAPWCGHCKKLTPEYSRAAIALKNSGSKVKLGKVDATQEASLAGRFEVRGYPTLKFFIGGNPVAYEGGRTESEIISWINKKTLPSTHEVSSLEDFDNIVKSHNVVVVFWGDKSHSAWEAFEGASRQFDDVQFVFTTHEDVKSKHEADSDDVITILKKFDEGSVDYSGELEATSITDFIKEHQFATVMEFDQKVAQKIFSESQPALFLITQNDDASERAKEALKAIASKLKGKIALAHSNIDEGLGGRLAEFVGVSRSQLPAIRLLRTVPGGNPSKFLYEKDITPEGIFEFFEEFTSGSLKPYLKSEPIPETQEGSVVVIVGKNFEDVVLDENTDVLIEFYAPWCGHCKSLAPAWDAAADQTKNVQNLVIAKCDATVNEVEGVNISGYPTIKFYPAHDKQNPIDFNGDRTAEGIVRWLKENTKGAKWEGFTSSDDGHKEDHHHDHDHDHHHDHKHDEDL